MNHLICGVSNNDRDSWHWKIEQQNEQRANDDVQNSDNYHLEKYLKEHELFYT